MNEKLAINNGTPVRNQMLSYGKQFLDEDDIQAVVDVLKSDWLTGGPKVKEFEETICQFVGTKEAVAVSSGTAALHATIFALDLKEGDEVIVPALTFVATANCVIFQKAKPVIVDVDPASLLIDCNQIEEKIGPKTKAIIAMDYAGHPCDYGRLNEIAKRHNIMLIADACHSLGGSYKEQSVGSLADLTTFSFHPVKHITTGEGGMIVTNNPEFAKRMRMFRNHGINKDFKDREKSSSWVYDMVDLGYNYRLSDFQCALGISQLKKLPNWINRRREIAQFYEESLAKTPEINPLEVSTDVQHAYHLYPVLLDLKKLNASQDQIFKALRAEGIGVNVHYIPLHFHSFYQKFLGVKEGDYPVAEAAYSRLISLPMYPAMTDRDATDVIIAIEKICNHYSKEDIKREIQL